MNKVFSSIFAYTCLVMFQRAFIKVPDLEIMEYLYNGKKWRTVYFYYECRKDTVLFFYHHYADIPKFRYIFKFYAQVCHFDTCVGSSSDEEEQQRWNEDPFSGRLSVVDSAFSTLPPHLIDKHWNWVTILDLSRNHIELSVVHKVSCLVRSTFLSIIIHIFSILKFW